MISEKNTGRVAGLVLLVQTLIAPLAYIRLLPPLSSPDFLESADPNALQVRIALLLTLLMGALTITTAMTVWMSIA